MKDIKEFENKIILGDSYKVIKEIPDKSIDLVYIDIPYLIGANGGGNSELARRIIKENYELGNKHSETYIKRNIKKFDTLMKQAKSKEEYEKYRILKNIEKDKLNLNVANIVSGIDYSILDELCRVMRYIYIYMV